MAEPVQLRQTNLEIRLHPPGPPCRLATLHRGGRLGYYPYPRLDVLAPKPRRRRFRAFIIENRFLQATIIPDLGAHLYRLYDRQNRQDCFACPPVLKYGRVHLRGAWLPLGIEINFPIGHTVSTASPVRYALRRGSDGSASLCLACHHWCTRMHWEVHFTLRPDDARLHVHTRLSNPTDVPRGFMYWANAAVWVGWGFRMQGRARMGDVWGQIIPFPVHNGRDWTWYRNRLHSSDLFAICPDQGWFGYYDHDRRYGMVHVADPRIMPGKKFFSWGRSQDGLIWGHIFATEPRHYGEIQAGLAENQGLLSRIEPGQTIQFDELWYPIAKLGDVIQASQHLAAGLSVTTATTPQPELRLICPTDRHVQVQVSASTRTLLDRRLALQAGRCTSLPLPAWPEQERLRLVIRQGSQVLLAGQLQQPEQADEAERLAYTRARDAAVPTDPLGRARRELDYNAFADVRPLLRQARRKRQEPAAIAVEQAAFHLRRFQHDQAWASLQAVPANRRDAAWHATAGDLLSRLDRPAQAVLAYQAATRSARLRRRALLGLARAQAASGQLPAALATADRLVATEPTDPDAHLLRAILLRHAGSRRQAARALQRATELAAALPGLDIEAWLAASAARHRQLRWQAVLDHSGGDVEYPLEIAWHYAHLGFTDDAQQILSAATAEPHWSAAPLALLTLAWLLRNDDPTRAEQLLDRAARCDWAAGTPHRWESLQVLDWATRRRPDSGRLHYWRGCLLHHAAAQQEATRAWQHAVRCEPALVGARRNLGYLLFRQRRRGQQAWEHYRLAVAGEPDEPHLIEEAQYVLCWLGRLTQRVALLRKAVARRPDCDKLVRLLAVALQDVGQFKQAIDVMNSTEFSPWEGERTLAACYAECRLALARLAVKAGKLAQAQAHYVAAAQRPANLNLGRSFRGDDAHSLYGQGLVAWLRDQPARAHELWEEAACRQFSFRWAGQVNSVEPFSACLANLRIGRRSAAAQLAERMIEAANWADRNFLRAEPHGNDPYRWPHLAGLAWMILGKRARAISAFRLVLDSYGPHEATIGKLALLEPGKWLDRSAHDVEWLGLPLC